MLSILAKIGFDWQVALANLVNFLIILFILKRYAFTPIKTAIKSRQELIQKGVDDARKAETDKIMAEELRESTLREARKKADEIVSSANKQAEHIQNQAKEDALKIKERIIKDGEKTIEKAHDEMISKVKHKSAVMIASGIEKILGENMTEALNESYIKKV